MLLLIGAPPLWAQLEAGRNIRVRLAVLALIDIEPNNSPITLNFTGPTEAGNPIQSTTDNTKWLNYSSALSSTDSARTISAAVDQTIAGIDLEVMTSIAMGGNGVLGTPFAPTSTVLSTTPLALINGIRGAFTGDGAMSGHQLTYSLDINDYTAIVANTQNITVTYTISN